MRQLLLILVGLTSFQASLIADTITVSSPVDWQVVQRYSKEKGKIHVAGKLETQRKEIASVEAKLSGKNLKGEWQKILFAGKAESFRGVLEAPAGGWYRLELRASDDAGVVASSVVEHVGVGEVFVVAGQSNSANHGEKKLEPKSGMVTTFDGKAWRIANDPQPGASGNAGSFVPPFGDAIARRFEVPVGIVACGVGATSVREWLKSGTTFPNPPTILGNVLKKEDGTWEAKGNIYQKFVSRMQPLGERGFRAVLWHQGESDANQKDESRTLKGELYQKYLEMLIRDSRAEIGWEAPWFVAQASYHSPTDSGSEDIRSAQRRVAESGLALIGPDTDALGGDNRDGNGKGVHFSAKGQENHAGLWVAKVAPWLEKQLGSGKPSTKSIGPERGALVIVGGGMKDREIMRRFVNLAGGANAVIAVIPTANEGENFGDNSPLLRDMKSFGASRAFILHTRDRTTADSEEFASKLNKVTGVWFGGGRQWRLVDSYLGTKTQKELFAVLERGGVIGGSSAGASIQSSYMVRGAREGNTIMMAPGYEQGLGFLRDCAIDQHLLARKRENDLVEVIRKHPHLLGIGIDENTAVVVQGNKMEVMGASKVAIYDPHHKHQQGEKPYFFLSAGDRFDLKERRKLP